MKRSILKKVYPLLVLSLFVAVVFKTSNIIAASYTYGEGIPESSVYFTEPGTSKWITGIELASGEEFSFDVWISDVLIGRDGLKIWFLKVWVGDQLESGNLAEYVSFEPLGGFIVEHMELECPSYYGPGWAAIAESFPGPEGDLPLVRLTYKGSGTTTITPASYYVGLYADFGMCDGTELDVGYQGMNVVVDGGGSIYANSHNYTPSGQPPRYCPPGPPHAPIGLHPEYALGSPDEKGTGWGPETGELILGFPSPLKNVEGDDLTIWHVGDGTPKIWVSTQLENPDYWHEIGSLPASQEWRTDSFEFGNLDIIHYVKVEEWQSGQHTCHFIDAMGDQGAASPQVDIKINGQDGPLTLHQSDTFSLAIGLDNNGITDDADWWLAVNTPFGLYTFYSWVPYLETVYQGPLFYIPLTDPLGFPISGLPSGIYTFYFVVDTVMDGNLSVDNMYFDYIEVNIEP